MTKELLNKFEIGEPLTNDDCKKLFKFFSVLSDSLKLMGPEYHLIWSAIIYKRNKIGDYIEFRKWK